MLNPMPGYLFSKLTTLGLGGPVKYLYKVKNKEELIQAINFAKLKKTKLLVIGGGSNLLVSDKGFNGVVIKNQIEGVRVKKNKFYVNSGTTLQDFIDITIEKEFSGINKMTGIPGTVGGALYGNAGAYGQTISDFLESILVFIPSINSIKVVYKKDCLFSYRNSIFKNNDWVILSAIFKFNPGNKKDLLKETGKILQKRLEKYPPTLKCPGSFFKNIQVQDLNKTQLKKIPKNQIIYNKIPAGFLLESVNAKSDSLNRIKITDYHANLFVNLGDGTASDFYKLAKKYYRRVKRKFGILLEPEVELINLPPFN